MMNQVIQFNHEVLGIQARPIEPLNFTESSHLIKCMNEEVEEFKKAYEYGDFIGMIDALMDEIYFAMGGLYKMGFTNEMAVEIFTAIHEANMEKKLGKVAHRDTGAPDAVKPNGWIPPEERIAKILDKHMKVRGQ